MEKYELLYILAAKYTDEEIGALMEKFKGVVTSMGGKVSEMHNLGRRKLAYPIGHVRNGNYVLKYFEAEPETMAKLNDTLRLSTDILRHIVVLRSPHLKGIPSFAEAPERNEETGEPRRPRQMAPIQVIAKPSAPVSMAEIDKKLDAILNEDVK